MSGSSDKLLLVENLQRQHSWLVAGCWLHQPLEAHTPAELPPLTSIQEAPTMCQALSKGWGYKDENQFLSSWSLSYTGGRGGVVTIVYIGNNYRMFDFQSAFRVGSLEEVLLGLWLRKAEDSKCRQRGADSRCRALPLKMC